MTRSELLPAIAAALAAAFPAIAIVRDDYGSAARQAMDDALRTAGVVIVITPLLRTVKLGQADSRSGERAFFSIHCRLNSAIALAPEPYALHSALITAVLGLRSVRAELAADACHLLEDDIGLLSHSLNFTATIVT